MNMDNIESTGSTASTEREDFVKTEARLDEIKGMNIGDMSDEEAENVLAERKALRAQQAEMMGSAQEEATAEGQVREVYDEAHQENQEIIEAEKKVAEAEKVAAEAAAQAEQAEQSAIRRQAELEEADALLAEIKGGNAGTSQETPVVEGKQESAAESLPSFDEERARKLLLTNELTYSNRRLELSNPEDKALYDSHVEAHKEKKKIVDELYSKIGTGDISLDEKAVLLEYIAQDTKDFGPYQVPEKFRSNPEVKAAALSGMSVHQNKRFVESW